MRRQSKIRVTAIGILIGFYQPSYAVTAVGQIYMSVVRSLSIIETQAMAFTPSSPGDEETTIHPEDTNSGTFEIRGEANMSYQIHLPDEALLKTGDGLTPEETIKINKFESVPSSQGTLSASGEQTLRIGATRLALAPNQVQGTYTGTYNITIVY